MACLVSSIGPGALFGCDEDWDEPSAVSPPSAAGSSAPAPAPSPAAAFTMPIGDLREAVREGARGFRRDQEGSRAVERARSAAALARVWALREPGGEGLETARELLREASRDASVDAACEAALELARLEARDAVRLREAYVEAYRTRRRFAGRSGTQGCVREARRLTRVLDAHRPEPDVLAAIDAESERAAPQDTADIEAWAATQEVDTDSPAVLEEVVVYGAGPDERAEAPGVVRVVLRFDRVAVFDRGELPAREAQSDGEAKSAREERSARLYLDFDGTRLGPRMGGSTEVDAGGLERIRLGRRPDGVARVVFDLRPGTRHRLFFLTDPYRVVVDLERAAPSRSSRADEDRGPARTILLDPGHGGDDYGARHGGLRESRVALDITRRAARLLERRLPHARVLMTRHGDDFVSLEQRTAMANAADADLFVSVHLNASDEAVERGGLATFVLDVNKDEQALRLAARENGTSMEEVTGLQRILADLHRRSQGEASRKLAAQVHDALLVRARQVIPGLPDRGVKEAMFYVLVGARMPAVLVEASFLTHPVEAQMLATDRYRQALADGIAEGIQRYVQSLEH